MEVTEHAIACTLTALYLNGGPNPDRLPRTSWRKVEISLRREAARLASAETVLRQAGHWLEASTIGKPGYLAAAEALVLSSRVIVASSSRYPARWRTALGDNAPPVLWCSGLVPELPFFGIVGSRQVAGAVASFASDSGKAAVAKGYAVVSGGAAGCDRAAAKGATAASPEHLLELLPYGLSLARPAPWCRLSVVAPTEPFSHPAAMERNALIYAASEACLVVRARFKSGGTWHGAINCLRRRLTPLFAREDGSQAWKALVGLGAASIREPGQLFESPRPGAQPHLNLA
jgi:predicted Rossmann fold nucleotide-binding protein DprA/Smf involved in DNA uptake